MLGRQAEKSPPGGDHDRLQPAPGAERGDGAVDDAAGLVDADAQVDAATAARAVELGVHAHLAKPFSAAELSGVLRRLVTTA